MSMDELSPEELELFINESTEMVDTIEELLVDLETGGDPEAVAAIFRAAHTLKGGAATAGMTRMAELTHALESLLDMVRSGERAVDADIIDALLEAIDVLRRCLAAVEREGTDSSVEVATLARRLESLAAETPLSVPGGPASGEPPVQAAAGDAPAAEAEIAAAGAAGGAEGAPDAPGGASAPASPWAAAAQEAAAMGERLWRFDITVDPDSPMPVVRLYQSLLVLQERGRVLHTDPPQAAIEAGEADYTRMTAVVATAEEPARIREALAEVNHLQAVRWDDPLASPPAEKGPAPGEPAPGPAAGTAAAAAAPAPPAASRSGPAVGGGTSPASGTGPGGKAPAPPAGGGSPAPAAGTMADTIRVNVRGLDRLMNLVGELVIDRTRLARLGHVDMSLQDLREELELVTSHLSRITTDLQDTIMQARMVPLETLFRKFPRMVRDLARKLDKQVRFVISGEDTELDRAVIEQIGDPLVHLIRNAVDHGLESPDQRRAAGKDPEGTVHLRAYHQENSIYIEVIDDGRGIDAAAIKAAAVARGLITAEQAEKLDSSETLDLLFLPGFTTAGRVSDVSGRGVGLDVVRKNIERVNGTVTVESEVGKGTRWIVRLPLTLAIVQAMLVRVRGTTFAVPLQSVMEILRVDDGQLRMANGWRMIHVRDQVIPLVNPGDVWGPEFAATWQREQANPVVVLQASAPLALAVDQVIGEQEIVIKTIEGMGGQVTGISGASILGDGAVALILDVTGFAKEVRRLGAQIGRDGGRHDRSA
ncbi:MAG: chemotaxis protein CheA [Limnochordales bacterium]